MTANAIAQYPQGGGAMTLIQEQVSPGTQATITFSNIPQTFKHLKLVVNAVSASNAGDYLCVQTNGITTATYVTQGIICSTTGAPSGFGSFGRSNIPMAGSGTGEATLTNYQAGTSLQGMGYGDGGNCFMGGGYGAAGAVTSITLSYANATNFVAGGVFSLFGIS